MQNDSLQFATTQELIQELMHRSSFVGILIYSPVENRSGVIHKDFHVISTVERKQMIKVADSVISAIRHT